MKLSPPPFFPRSTELSKEGYSEKTLKIAFSLVQFCCFFALLLREEILFCSWLSFVWCFEQCMVNTVLDILSDLNCWSVSIMRRIKGRSELGFWGCRFIPVRFGIHSSPSCSIIREIKPSAEIGSSRKMSLSSTSIPSFSSTT